MQPSAVEGFLGSNPFASQSSRSQMPRYFMDFQDGPVWLEDEEGQEYDTLRAARDAAIAALPDIGREGAPSNGKRTFVAFVRNEHGTEHCTVRLNLDAECHSERSEMRTFDRPDD